MMNQIIQFPRTKDPLDLDFPGMGIKIDHEEQREIWAAIFASTQTALWFCNLDRAEGEKAVREFDVDGLVDGTGTEWSATIDYLDALIKMMKGACVRLEFCEERVIAAKNRMSP